MDTLTLELLSSLLSNIEDEAIGQLSITRKYMENITNKLKDDAIFYKSRVENLLGYSIDRSYKGNWKEFYYVLIEEDYGKADWLTSALLSASYNGNDLAIKVLLADNRGKSKVLLIYAVDPSFDNNYAIRRASMDGYLEIVKLFLADQRVDPSDYNNTAIQWASQKGRLEVVKLLLADQRIDPSDEYNYAIRLASENGNLEVVKLLLADQRVDPSDDNNNAIQLASLNGYLEVVELLLADQRVDPSGQQNTAIQWASMNGHLDIVKLLIGDQRVDPSACDNYAIRWASENGHIEVVKLLLADQRVDPSGSYNLAIQRASKNGHIEVMKLLMGSNKINLSVKTQALKELQSSSELSYDMNYDNIEKLATKSLKELIQIGNQNLQDREIIMTKYFWWLRLRYYII